MHADRYDYSQVRYLNGRTKVKIVCREHGVFEQLPKNHLYLNQECPVCVGKGKSNIGRFITGVKNVHGDKYDYSDVIYVNNRSKIKIICPEHGMFQQTPTRHLSGDGCPSCNGGIVLDVNEFIERAVLLQGKTYDYSECVYINSQTKIKIICSEHGIFRMKPNNHLSGQGCPECGNKSFGEKYVGEWLNQHSINFEKQKTFSECKNERLLRFDFYLSNENMLIEYDGEQHYKPINFFGGENGLKYIRNNDKIKTNFAKDNDIKLLRIKYGERNVLSDVLENNIEI